MKKTKNNKGFTLVELVIVIAVIAILAAVLIPTFVTVIGNANESAALQEGSSLKTEILTLAQGDFDSFCDEVVDSGDFKEVQLADPVGTEKMMGYDATVTYGKFVSKLDSTNSKITVTYKNNVGTITYLTDKGYGVKITADKVETKKGAWTE